MATKEYGQNVKVTVVKGKMTIEIDTTKTLGNSKSGKTITIGSTKGNVRVELENGKEIVLGVNCYKYPEE